MSPDHDPAPAPDHTHDWQYKAFISYSHRDRAWGDWLHRALETYRVPKRLVGRSSPMGPVPARITPVFRDREELPTATDLGTVINAALEASATLVVICSPHAAKSRWVNEEILAYKRMGRGHRILSLIVAGEPNAADKPELGLEECFPEALKYRVGPDGELSEQREEPVAADARPGGDGKAAARLKLLAGILGVGYDELRQREQQRRQRRLVAVTAASLAAVVAAAGLTVNAMLARQEAEQERARAEVEAETARQTTDFLVSLFQFSDPYEARGRTITVQEVLAEGAARIHTELADQPAVQGRMMETIGAAYRGLGLWDEGKPLLEGALERAEQTEPPGSLEVARLKADLAYMLIFRAEWEEAERLAREAAAIYREDGTDPLGLATVLNHLAFGMLRAGGRAREAEAVCREILALTADRPEGGNDEATALFQLGWALQNQRRFEEAEAAYRSSLELRQALYGGDHPQIAHSLNNLGSHIGRRGRYDEGMEYLNQAWAMNWRLFGKEHPEMGWNLYNMSAVHRVAGHLGAAEETARLGLGLRRRTLGPDHPESLQSLNDLAVVRWDRGDMTGAEAAFTQILEAHRRAGREDTVSAGIAMNNLAETKLLLGRAGEALSLYAQARDLMILLNGPDHRTVMVTTLGYGDALRAVGRIPESRTVLAETLPAARRTLGDQDSTVAGYHRALAETLIETGEIDAACDHAGNSVEAWTRIRSPGHWQTAVARSVLGACLARQGRPVEARTLLTESRAVLVSLRGENDYFARQATRRLAALDR